MSPEQSLANAVGPAADVYALACVLHELLTGKPPFTPDDSRSHMWHHVHTPAPPIRTLRPGRAGRLRRPPALRPRLRRHPDSGRRGRPGPTTAVPTTLRGPGAQPW
ncbi:hypothetical protein [Streptomyces sp. BP-8]|uniref:Protein kinase domain-containing protein n=1 Tax=Streptomyces sirii TaxID=3127701 RepID=A0ABZ2R031_9ACTN